MAVIVHPENPLESLPMDEARAIFCGEIKKMARRAGRGCRHARVRAGAERARLRNC